MPDRRQFVCTISGLAAAHLIAARTWAQTDPFPALISAFTGGVPARPGRVTLEIPPLADNGNAVPLRIRVNSAMSAADHVRRLTILSEKNPRPVIATFFLGPYSGRALIDTRVRLNGAQRLMAIAHMSDDSYWSGMADVIVTSTACWDES